MRMQVIPMGMIVTYGVMVAVVMIMVVPMMVPLMV